MPASPSIARAIPSVDRLLASPQIAALIDRAGRPLVVETVRALLDEARRAEGPALLGAGGFDETTFARACERRVDALLAPSMRRVLNFTGTVLHTNLGRALLAREAAAAAAEAMAGATNLEFDIGRGQRGDRDSHVEAWLRRLTGAEAATVVNNNAAAVLLTLNALAARREVIVSRGELVEIGGEFRIPEIMTRAGAKLIEVGATNRTHLRDYEAAIGPRTAALMKVHTSNYAIQGFTAAVPETRLGELAAARGLPFLVDLGSGMLVDIAQWGLPHEPTPQEAIAAGAHVVTFSGDKLLGGPQAGLIVGSATMIARIKRNPLKRALRCSKIVIAALEATLRIYADPARLAERLPTLRYLSRPLAAIETAARAVLPAFEAALQGRARVSLEAVKSQIGSGSLPIDLLPSLAIALRPAEGGKRAGAVIERLARAFRALPVPVIGRIHDGALLFDLRMLDDAAELIALVGKLDAGRLA